MEGTWDVLIGWSGWRSFRFSWSLFRWLWDGIGRGVGGPLHRRGFDRTWGLVLHVSTALDHSTKEVRICLGNPRGSNQRSESLWDRGQDRKPRTPWCRTRPWNLRSTFSWTRWLIRMPWISSVLSRGACEHVRCPSHVHVVDVKRKEDDGLDVVQPNGFGRLERRLRPFPGSSGWLSCGGRCRRWKIGSLDRWMHPRRLG
mmetsp:Transcript_4944/g.31653  ORF Transcript_4944/g.31653 Transcript_4944/m.31653 type:complete len:200 (+) Transcript_4944:2450-3049(+)